MKFFILFFIAIVNSSFWDYWTGDRKELGYNGGSEVHQLSPEFMFSRKIDTHYKEAVDTLRLLENNENSCWEESKEYVIQNCGKTGYDDRTKIAMKLSNCHLKLSGLDRYTCGPRESNFEDCRKFLAQETKSYQVYNMFFTHIDNICNYMKADHFRQTSLASVKKLYESAQNTGEYLDKISLQTKRIQSDISVKQNALLKNQKTIIEDNKNLGETLLNFRESNDDHFHAMEENQNTLLDSQKKIKELAEISGSTLEKLQTDQSIVLDSLEGVQTISQDIYSSVEMHSEQINHDLKNIESSASTIYSELTTTHANLQKLQQDQIDHFDDVQKSVETLKLDLFDIIDLLRVDVKLIRELDARILSELFYVHGFIFYCLSFVLFWILTSSQRSSSARIPIYLILLLALMTEGNFNFEKYNSFRKFIFLQCIIILCYKIYYYSDLSIQNNKLLKKLLYQRQNGVSERYLTSFPRRPILCNIRFKKSSFSRSVLDRLSIERK